MLDGTKYTGTTEGSYGSVVGLLEGSVIWEGTGDGGIRSVGSDTLQLLAL